MLKSITIEGFKSIKSQKIELGPLNVLIGANGSGKSNLLSAFRFLRHVAKGDLQNYVAQQDGADSLLYFGRKRTEQLSFDLDFESYSYSASLRPTPGNLLAFSEERGVWCYLPQNEKYEFTANIASRGFESKLDALYRGDRTHAKAAVDRDFGLAQWVANDFTDWRVFDFNDTSESARVKQHRKTFDNVQLHEDAANLVSMLYLFQEAERPYYDRIVRTIRLVAPFFDDFVLEPEALGNDSLRIKWREKGSDQVFGIDSLSDGTIRFICLATLISQPDYRIPKTLIIDEPELGLHPFAISVLAGMLQSFAASMDRQVIVATQSVTLVNQLEMKDIIVVNRGADGSTFDRPNPEELQHWLQEYSLGELWEKNVLGGRPSRW